MTLKSFKPTTPSNRSLIQIDRSKLWKDGPYKPLVGGLTKSGGRNNTGRITSFHRGGGHKRLYRIIDFKRNKDNMYATVERVEYDPNRTAFIALVCYEDQERSYIIAPEGLKVGDKIISGDGFDVKPGNCLPLRDIPVGTSIHNVELKSGKGAQMVRSAGGYCQLMSKDNGYAQLRLSSGEMRLVSLACRATIGIVSNADKKNISHGKAGRVRWLGFRPVVRGVAQNPVDHPHGGGEGKTSGGRHPVTPWGLQTRGFKTRKNKRTNQFIVKRRK